VFVGGCFDPERPSGTGGDDDDATAGTGTTGGACEPGAVEPCVCEDGGEGTRGCAADGSGFGICACETVDTTDDATVSSSAAPPECVLADDCTALEPSDCEAVACDDGVCALEALDAGTACGDATMSECSGADQCDGAGTCANNDVAAGLRCTSCESGACTYAAGACGDCDEFAPTNSFTTERAIEGWTLSGDWGLYRAAPQNFSSGQVAFASQVFGTDGNRAEPYPSSEDEESTARTGPTVLPANLEFLSWNQDEGANVDTKQVRVSVDGGATFLTLVDCNVDGGMTPFCVNRSDRAADDWDAISLALPPELIGEIGVVEFYYDTTDPCCDFERGWFIDELNFATECACVDDSTCAGLGSECGEAQCTAMGACDLDAVVAGTTCGDTTENQCDTADACDGVGFCASGQAVNGLTDCSDCPGGVGECNACQEGACVDCDATIPLNDFNFGSEHGGWLIEDLSGTGADWQIFFGAPQSAVVGSVATPLSFAPSFGTDGNRQSPYPGAELEHSRVTTAPDTVPAAITFSSWNVDEAFDNKVVEISVDDGESWAVLVDCDQQIGTQVFCNDRFDPRSGDEWDAIVLDTAGFEGMVGRLRFTYNSKDGCCDLERGWFIDNLDFAQYCQESPFE